MQVLAALCFLVLAHLPPLRGEVVESFKNISQCLDFFYNRTVPELRAATPGAARLCQRLNNSYHFATLYDTHHRIAIYSAYRFQTSNSSRCKKRWFVEPQLVHQNWSAEMQTSDSLKKDNPGVYLGEKQALNEDYNNSGFTRGHLNPSGHHPVPSCNATFTLTNVVPQSRKLNQKAWARYESELTKIFNGTCAKAYVLVGAIPSANNWINERVNIPDYIWNAYCCLDKKGQPISSGGVIVPNIKQRNVTRCTLSDLEGFLSQYPKSPVGKLFFNNCQL